MQAFSPMRICPKEHGPIQIKGAVLVLPMAGHLDVPNPLQSKEFLPKYDTGFQPFKAFPRPSAWAGMLSRRWRSICTGPGAFAIQRANGPASYQHGPAAHDRGKSNAQGLKARFMIDFVSPSYPVSISIFAKR